MGDIERFGRGDETITFQIGGKMNYLDSPSEFASSLALLVSFRVTSFFYLTSVLNLRCKHATSEMPSLRC